jgi:ubiquinone/menaquinone biosynthesis C-methylase UbiE
MSSYRDFAAVYDRLMHEDIDYNAWADYLEAIFKRYEKTPRLICDLACGTGNVTLPLAQRGYEMIGVDRSFDMLAIAREKAADKKQDILFLQQDMTKLDLYGTVDVMLCMIDGLNYILLPSQLLALFKRVKTCFLEQDGLFVFDISTRHKLSHTLGSNTFIYNEPDVFYTWQNRYRAPLCDMLLTFFVRQEGGWYKRFEERHLQHAYSNAQICALLFEAGFEKVDLFDALSFETPKKGSERVFFVAR